jgi:hypothetical protein
MTMTIITTKTSDGHGHGNRDGGRSVLMVVAVMTFVSVLMVVVIMQLAECFSFPSISRSSNCST